MPQNLESVIDGLVADLQPVRPLSRRRGMALAAGGFALAIATVAWLTGLRADLVAGRYEPEFLVPAGMFLMLGLVAAYSAISMAQPQVGARNDEWKWAAAMAAILPASGLLAGLLSDFPSALAGSTGWGIVCLGTSLAAGMLPLCGLVVWLRRGAPSSPTRAGIVAGLAAASLGTFAWSLHCPINSLLHIGLWHGLAPLAGATLGYLLIRPLVRW